MASNSILASMAVKLGADVSEFSRAMATAKKDLAGFKKAGEAMKGFGESLSKYISAPLAGIAAVSLKTYGDIQALKKGLEAVAGSASGAEKQFSDLKEVAKLPGLGLEEAVRGSIRLQAIGFSAEQAQKSLQVFGNAIATVGGGRAELDRAIHGLQQLANTDFPLGEDLNILKDAIPQITPLLKEAFGTARSEELQKLGISSKEVVRVITEGLGALPPVAGGLKNSFENLSDSTKIAFASIGEAINKNLNVEGLLNAIAGKLTALAEGFNQLSPGVQRFIVISGALVAALGPILVVFGGILTAIPSMIAGYTALKLATTNLAAATTRWAAAYGIIAIKIIAITAAVAALALIAKSIYDAWDGVAGWFASLWAKIRLSFANSLLSIIQSINKFGKYIGVEFKETEASLLSFAKAAQENLDATPVVTFTEAISGVGQAITDNLNTGIDAIKGFFFQTSEGAKEAAKEVDKFTTSLKRAGTGPNVGNGASQMQGKGIGMVDSQATHTLPMQLKLLPVPENEVREVIDPLIQHFVDFAQQASELINKMIVDSIVALGDAIGNAIAGNGMQGFFDSFLLMLFDFARDFGKILIATGAGKIALDAMAFPGGGVGMVVAGTALVALAGAAKAMVAKGPGAPKSASPNYSSGFTGNGFTGNEVEFRIKGDDLVGIMGRRDYRNRRFGG